MSTKPTPTSSRAETIAAINRSIAPAMDQWDDVPRATEIYDRFVAPLKREQAIASSSLFAFERMLEQLYTQNFLLAQRIARLRKGSQSVETSARKLLQEAGGLLLPWEAYKDGDTITLVCSKENVLALKQALNDD